MHKVKKSIYARFNIPKVLILTNDEIWYPIKIFKILHLEYLEIS